MQMFGQSPIVPQTDPRNMMNGMSPMPWGGGKGSSFDQMNAVAPKYGDFTESDMMS